MNIFDPSAFAVLSLMEKSTDHRYYAAELQDITEYSKTAILNTLATIRSAGFAAPRKEEWGTYHGRAPRTYYEPTQYFLNVWRMAPLSSLSSL
jgi:hypothetical protein